MIRCLVLCRVVDSVVEGEKGGIEGVRGGSNNNYEYTYCVNDSDSFKLSHGCFERKR